MNKNSIIINSLRHAAQIRDTTYFNAVLRQCYKELGYTQTPPRIGRLDPQVWNNIVEIANTTNEETDCVDSIVGMLP